MTQAEKDLQVAQLAYLRWSNNYDLYNDNCMLDSYLTRETELWADYQACVAKVKQENRKLLNP